MAFASTGNLDAAEEPFSKACQHQPEEKSNWLNMARLHQAKGNSAGAKAAMQRANGLL